MLLSVIDMDSDDSDATLDGNGLYDGNLQNCTLSLIFIKV